MQTKNAIRGIVNAASFQLAAITVGYLVLMLGGLAPSLHSALAAHLG